MIGHKGARLRERRHPRPAADRGAARHARSTSTCTSRSPRTGSATRASCASWASEPSQASQAPSRRRTPGPPPTAPGSATRSPTRSRARRRRSPGPRRRTAPRPRPGRLLAGVARRRSASTVAIARQVCGSLQSTRWKSGVVGSGRCRTCRTSSARPASASASSKEPVTDASCSVPATAITSQRYQFAPASDCFTLAVNQTARSMLSRSCSSVAPRKPASCVGQRAATWSVTAFGVHGEQVSVDGGVEVADRVGLAGVRLGAVDLAVRVGRCDRLGVARAGGRRAAPAAAAGEPPRPAWASGVGDGVGVGSSSDVQPASAGEQDSDAAGPASRARLRPADRAAVAGLPLALVEPGVAELVLRRVAEPRPHRLRQKSRVVTSTSRSPG